MSGEWSKEAKQKKKKETLLLHPLWSLRLSFYFNHILAVRVKRARIKACLCWGEGGGDTREEPVAALIASSHSAWFPVLSQCVTLSLTVVTCLSLCVCVSLSLLTALRIIRAADIQTGRFKCAIELGVFFLFLSLLGVIKQPWSRNKWWVWG